MLHSIWTILNLPTQLNSPGTQHKTSHRISHRMLRRILHPNNHISHTLQPTLLHPPIPPISTGQKHHSMSHTVRYASDNKIILKKHWKKNKNATSICSSHAHRRPIQYSDPRCSRRRQCNASSYAMHACVPHSVPDPKRERERVSE